MVARMICLCSESEVFSLVPKGFISEKEQGHPPVAQVVLRHFPQKLQTHFMIFPLHLHKIKFQLVKPEPNFSFLFPVASYS